MKRKHLILSLICSIAVAIALITFTIISVIPKDNNGDDVNKQPVSDVTDTDKKDINAERDGSIEKPYLINSAEMFNEFIVGKYLDADGNYIDYNAVDKDGNLLNAGLNSGINYELASDIDFAESNFVSLFNKGIAFNGSIDGKGFSLKNINIEVTKENLANFMYNDEEKGFRAHVGLFGALKNAKITNLNISNINVTLNNEVLEYLRSTDTTFVADYKNIMFEVTVGLVAGLAFDSEISVNVDGKLDAFSYCYREDEKTAGCNAIGGLIGSTVGCDISKSSAKVEMKLDGKAYFVGGLVGKAYNTKANEVKSELTVTAKYNQNIYVGGACGYISGLDADGINVSLKVNEISSRLEADIVELLSSDKVDSTINIAGIAPYIRANDDAQKAIIKNASVDSNIAIDGVYAGAFIEIWSSADTETKTVFIENMTLVSKVDVLRAYGLARLINNAEIKTKLACEQAGYDIVITGKVNFSDDAFEIIAKNIDNVQTTFGEDAYESLTIKMDANFVANLDMTDLFLMNMLKNANRLDFSTAGDNNNAGENVEEIVDEEKNENTDEETDVA